MTPVRFSRQPRNVAEAVLFAEAHVRASGFDFLSPLDFALGSHEVTAAMFAATTLREKELLPGLKLRSGSSVVEVVRIIPTNREVVYRSNRGGLHRMASEKFVKLARQQGYKKIWNLTAFLQTLKNLLKPVLDSVPLMWVLRWILNMVRSKSKGQMFTTKVPEKAETLE